VTCRTRRNFVSMPETNAVHDLATARGITSPLAFLDPALGSKEPAEKNIDWEILVENT